MYLPQDYSHIASHLCRSQGTRRRGKCGEYTSFVAEVEGEEKAQGAAGRETATGAPPSNLLVDRNHFSDRAHISWA